MWMIRLPPGLRGLRTASVAMMMMISSSSNHVPRLMRWGNGLIIDEQTICSFRCTATYVQHLMEKKEGKEKRALQVGVLHTSRPFAREKQSPYDPTYENNTRKE